MRLGTAHSAAMFFIKGLAALGIFLSAGCASMDSPNPRDPWEPMNRQIFKINDSVDKAVVKPVAVAYKDYTPALLQTGINNFFGNLRDVWSAVNSALQLKGGDTAQGAARVVVNSTVGLLGVIDVATKINLKKHKEDFGQTLGYWGVPSGPYLVLPFFGPSDLRDASGFLIDIQINPTMKSVKKVRVRNSLYIVNAVDTRKGYLGMEDSLDAIALDRYSFVRDAYLQKRLYDIYDGSPPDNDE